VNNVLTIEFERPLQGGGWNVPITDASLSIWFAKSSRKGSGSSYGIHTSYTGFQANLVQGGSASAVGGGSDYPLLNPGMLLLLSVGLPLLVLAIYRHISHRQKKEPNTVDAPVHDKEKKPDGSPTPQASSLVVMNLQPGTRYKPKRVEDVPLFTFLHRLAQRRVCGTSVLVLELNLVLVVAGLSSFWVYGFDFGDIDAAESWGYICNALAFMTMLPATRNSFLNWMLFEPFEATIFYHRWLGRLTWVAAMLHGGYYVVEASQTPGQLKDSLQTEKWQNGLWSLGFLTIVVLTSFDIV
jgi:hypothetical protein